MNEIHLSGLLVQPITERVRDWNAAGKISEDDLDRVLTTDARAYVEHSIAIEDWAPLDDVEGLVALVAEQIGDETGFVEWAEEIVESWRGTDRIEALVRAGRSLADAPGFVASQISEILIRDADWFYDGGRAAFSVRVGGLRAASPALKSLLGALLAGLASGTRDRDFEVRFDGIDGDDLVVFGESPSRASTDAESRLHQAALVSTVR